MRITAINIENFKALTRFALKDLGSAIVLAGPNGCGKSCVLDAIRLVKSAYGGYQPNEWHSWFGEFAINFNQTAGDMLRLFQDKTREVKIEASISFADSETEYLKTNAEELVRSAVWREVVPELAGWRALMGTSFASQYRSHNAEVEQKTALGGEEFLAELDQRAPSRSRKRSRDRIAGAEGSACRDGL